MAKEKHKGYYRVPDIFSCDIRDLEFMITGWEANHMRENNSALCEDIRCMGTYLMLRTAYDYRVKVQKLVKTFDIFRYTRIDTFTHDNKNLHIIEGYTVRKFKEDDTIVLVSDVLEGDSECVVKDVIWYSCKDKVWAFQATVEFKGFENIANKN